VKGHYYQAEHRHYTQ